MRNLKEVHSFCFFILGDIIYENPPLTGDKVVQEIDDCGFEVSLVSDEGTVD